MTQATGADADKTEETVGAEGMEEMKTALEEVNEWYDANKEAEAEEDLEEKRKALAEASAYQPTRAQTVAAEGAAGTASTQCLLGFYRNMARTPIPAAAVCYVTCRSAARLLC
jgi:hypothetical protein